jgi:hypothetical protein
MYKFTSLAILGAVMSGMVSLASYADPTKAAQPTTPKSVAVAGVRFNNWSADEFKAACETVIEEYEAALKATTNGVDHVNSPIGEENLAKCSALTAYAKTMNELTGNRFLSFGVAVSGVFEGNTWFGVPLFKTGTKVGIGGLAHAGVMALSFVDDKHKTHWTVKPFSTVGGGLNLSGLDANSAPLHGGIELAIVTAPFSEIKSVSQVEGWYASGSAEFQGFKAAIANNKSFYFGGSINESGVVIGVPFAAMYGADVGVVLNADAYHLNIYDPRP